MSDPVLEALNRAAEEVTPADLDRIIAHLRKHRKDYEAGVKPKKADDIDLVKALKIEKPKIEGFVRRF